MPLNVLLITADDMDVATPETFGGPPGVTPRIDRFAAEGMAFHRAHVAAAVCQPSRSGIMTGRMPHRNGAEGFEPIHDGVPLLTDRLRPAGYRLGILGKVQHIQPVERFGWDLTRDIHDLGTGRDAARYGAATADFIAEAMRQGRPWFLMANAHDPHRPFHGSKAERERFTAEQLAGVPAPSHTFAPGEHTVPAFLPDIDGVRGEYAEYLSSARRCDDVVAAVLDAVEAAGAADSTVVFFLSDNGMAFPYAKANCYVQSTRTPFLVRWPSVTGPGSADHDAFVSMIDLFPTICDIAGVQPGAELDGRSLVPLLRGERETGREQVVTVFHETSAQLRFEMRAVQDARYGYVWNAWSDGRKEYNAENMEGLSWPAMLTAAEADPGQHARVQFYLHRAREELYDLVEDPASLRNLAEDPRFARVLGDFRSRLAAWMNEHGDPLHQCFAEDAQP